MVRSTSQTASGRARARLARSPGSPSAQFSVIADRLPAGSAVPLGWHITPSPFTSPSPSPSPCPSSPESSVSSSCTSASSRASSPASSRSSSPLSHKSRSSCSRRSQKDPSHVSRPLNAFIIFRKKKCPEIRAEGVERDNRIISRIVGGIWKKMSDVEKAPFRAEARRLADAHKAAHPNYRFSPQPRAEPKKRRNVKRRDEVTRQRVAAIAQAALEGVSMKDAAADFDAQNIQEPVLVGLEKDPSDQYTTGVFDIKAWVPPRPAREVEEKPFRSPLLPPSSLDDLSGLANLTISGGDASSPLSPLDLSVKQIQTPAYDYLPQPQMPAYAVHPSQPRGALALGDTYEADMAPSTAFYAQDAYSSQMAYGQVFSHDSHGCVAPAHQPQFVFAQHVPSPDVAVFGQAPLTLPFDSHYDVNAHAISSSSVQHVQPGAELGHTWPYVPVPSNDFQGFQPQEMTAFASHMQMQAFVAPMDGLSLNSSNAWPGAPYAHNGQMAMQNW
uniref:N/A n=1 Tax=Ganoderma boninense TaxID=34458 RepID=A0A5K1JYY2_9APHY|nr:N/A [Ganoderma boninense]